MREFQNVHLKGAESPLKHPDPDPPPAATESLGAKEPNPTTLNKPNINLDGEGLIVPRKLNNPCMDSKEVQSLTKDVKRNNRT